MSDFEQFKNGFATILTTHYGVNDIEHILMALSQAYNGFEILKKSTELAVLDNELPKMVKEYLVIKGIEGLSQATLNGYKMTLEMFFADIRKAPNEVEKNDIALYLYRYQQYRNISDRTLEQYRQYICRFFNWAYDEGYIDANPARTIKPIRYEKKQRQSLTQIELEYIRKACTNNKERALIEVLYSTGCRVSEIANAKIADIDWNTKQIAVVGKGRKHRKCSLNAKAEVALKAYLDERNDECEYLFATTKKPAQKLSKDRIERIVKGVSQRADIKKPVSPHILRHTTATQALRGGMNVETVSAYLGHTNLNTTMIYCEIDDDKLSNESRKYIV